MFIAGPFLTLNHDSSRRGVYRTNHSSVLQGNRDAIDAAPAGSRNVLTSVLKLVDAFDLYGSVAYPKKHTQADISDIYILPLDTRGVFTNVALHEPFGLTVIEAAGKKPIHKDVIFQSAGGYLLSACWRGNYVGTAAKSGVLESGLS